MASSKVRLYRFQDGKTRIKAEDCDVRLFLALMSSTLPREEFEDEPDTVPPVHYFFVEDVIAWWPKEGYRLANAERVVRAMRKKASPR